MCVGVYYIYTYKYMHIYKYKHMYIQICNLCIICVNIHM